MTKVSRGLAELFVYTIPVRVAGYIIFIVRDGRNISRHLKAGSGNGITGGEPKVGICTMTALKSS